MWPWSRRSDGTFMSQFESAEENQPPSSKNPNATTSNESSSASTHRALSIRNEQITRLRAERAESQAALHSQHEQLTQLRDENTELHATVHVLERQLADITIHSEAINRTIHHLHQEIVAYETSRMISHRSRISEDTRSNIPHPSPGPAPANPPREQPGSYTTPRAANKHPPPRSESAESLNATTPTPATKAPASPAKSFKLRRSIVSFAGETPPIVRKRAPLGQISGNVPAAQPRGDVAMVKGKGRRVMRAKAALEEVEVEVEVGEVAPATAVKERSKDAANVRERRLTRAMARQMGEDEGR